MTSSIILAVIGFSLLGVVSILDKFIVSNEKINPLVFVFYSTIITLPLVVLIPFVKPLGSIAEWGLAITSGVSYAVALYTLYRGFEGSEVSHVGPLVGAMVPICSLLLSQFFVPEFFSTNQMIAIALLVLGSLIISVENDRHFVGWHRGMLWGIVAAFFFALFYTTAKPVYAAVGMFSGLVWVWLPMGVVGLCLLFAKRVREHVFAKKEKVAASHKQAVIMVANKILALAAVLLTQFAISLGSVTIVNALTGLQYAVLVILVALLSYFWPQLYKEEYSRGEVVQEVVAVVLIASGLALLIV